MRPQVLLSILILSCSFLAAQQPDLPGQVAPGDAPVNQAYLCADMMHGDYGKLYYSVSRDGLNWHLLNGGKRVSENYHGHPDIVKGPDGIYYMAGNTSDSSPMITIYRSQDLTQWEVHSQ